MSNTKSETECSAACDCSLEQREKDAMRLIEIRRRNPELIAKIAAILVQQRDDEIEAAWMART